MNLQQTKKAQIAVNSSLVALDSSLRELTEKVETTSTAVRRVKKRWPLYILFSAVGVIALCWMGRLAYKKFQS